VSRRTAAAAARRIPRAAWICALVAVLNAACWSIVSPPFEIPDEPSHFAYVQRLAETGRLPSGSKEKFPRAEEAVLDALLYSNVRFSPGVPTISTQAAQRRLERTLAAPLPRTGSPQAGVAASQPPLYYALEVVPYKLASFGTLLDRLALMRLLSALMTGFTALFAFLFLRETLPGAPWAWTVGGLGIALAPLLALMSGAVNPDALLFAVCAALFWLLARGFRRGIDPQLAVALGAVLAVGLLTKLTFLTLLPGALLGLAALCIRAARTSPRGAWRSFALAVVVGASPVLLYGAVDALTGRPGLTVLSDAVHSSSTSGPLSKELSYVWQFYLPALPGMHRFFHGFLITRALWFNGLVGLYGWLDTTFPNWVYNAALLPAALIGALFARALFVCRGALRGRAVELGVYLVICLGVLGTIGVDDYIHHVPTEYFEPRYLLPLLALWGPILALAARGAGRRWGPVAGVLIVALLAAHDLFSGLLVVSRYYG
jgi:4-amino-4-deoxy-L-arabinose transferase-like glycosyltransferase